MIPLTISNATRTWQIERQVNENATVEALIDALSNELNLPLPGEYTELGEMVTVVGSTASLYHPRHGILANEKKISEYASLLDDPLILHFEYELEDLLATLQLDEENSFDEMLRMVTVNWHDEHYPILLPARATPQGNIEGSLMSTLIIEQLNRIRDVYIDPATIPHGQFYNSRTQQLIQPLDRVTVIGDQIRHGDMLEYRTNFAMPTSTPPVDLGPDLDIVILDDAASVQVQTPQPDSSILNEISISPMMDDADGGLPDVDESEPVDLAFVDAEEAEAESVDVDPAEPELVEPAAEVTEVAEPLEPEVDAEVVADAGETVDQAADEDGEKERGS